MTNQPDLETTLCVLEEHCDSTRNDCNEFKEISNLELNTVNFECYCGAASTKALF